MSFKRSYFFMLLVVTCLHVSSEALAAQGQDANYTAPRTLHEGTRQLSGIEISALVSQADIQRVVRPEYIWLEPPERFFKDGKYIRFQHRDKFTGSYIIEGNALCVKVDEEARTCRLIFIDRNRRYWISPTGADNIAVQIDIIQRKSDER